MAVQLSPGVNVSEVDLTTIVPSVSTSVGAIAGLFRWGPVGERVLLDSETTLVSRFGKPTNFNAETWFTAANFLSYTNALYVSRAANVSGAVASQTFGVNVVGNNYFTVSGGNTSGISAGMYVTQSNNSNVIMADPSVTVTSVVNSTVIQLSAPAGNTSAVTLYFGNPATSYSALGLEPGTFVSNLVNQIVTNENVYSSKDGNFQNGVTWVAKYPGAIGNSIRVATVDTASAYSSTINLSNVAVTGSVSIVVGANTATLMFSGDGTSGTNTAFAQSVVSSLSVGDQVLFGNTSINKQFIKITEIGSITTNTSTSSVTLNLQVPYRLATNYTANTLIRQWEYFNAVGVAPGQSNWQQHNGNTAAMDELHVVVVDELGLFTGTPGSILETFKGVSRATDAKNPDGTTNYYKDVINQGSAYVWWAADRPLAPSAPAMSLSSSLNTAPGDYYFSLGSDGLNEANVDLATIASGYDLFKSPEDIDVSIVLQGRPIGGTTVSQGQTVSNYLLANYIIDNLVDIRKDCVVAISPDKALTLNNFGQEAISLVAWRDIIHDSSYAVMDTGYKYQYDRYNDLYRWVPMNGDVGGLMARTDHTNDAWWSPAGFNRGQIKNLVKLAYNPGQTDRDLIYPSGINPVVTFPGKGTVLYGDKTLQSKPSAFDRINVRRLFIVLEKAISQAAKYSLFEFNDAFTQAQFKNLVTPYLRTVQGRCGVTDFLVVCDSTNNTPDIIDANQFVGDIYIKPARSINFIQLNFIAVGTGVQFSTVVGQF
jgi:phage tail sheath protein FI